MAFDTADELHLTSLDLVHFRNYDSFHLDELGYLTILVGPNAVGKTSVVEAIQLVTALESFRTSKASRLVKWGETRAHVGARLNGEARDLSIELDIKGSSRTYKLNGKTKRVADLAGLLPAVTFTPDDLHLVKGAAAARRDALDALGAQISKNFAAVRSDYAKLVKQKNRALKAEESDTYLSSIDDVLVRVGVQVLSHRMTIVERVQPYFQRFYKEISGGDERVALNYVPCWLRGDDDELTRYEFDRDEALSSLESYGRAMRPVERARRRTVAGPHADDVLFLLDGRNAVHFASQGQQRCIVLAYKLAEAAAIEDAMGRKPLLLLDDVMSELDERRRAYFMEFVADDIQTFITTTNAAYFTDAMKRRARIVRLGEGPA